MSVPSIVISYTPMYVELLEYIIHFAPHQHFKATADTFYFTVTHLPDVILTNVFADALIYDFFVL